MTDKQTDTLFHGGNISAASEQFGIAKEQWLDLSTGISPFAYPIPQIPNKYWQELPYPSKDSLSAAKHYYLGDKTSTNHQLLITAGSQFTIQHLPKILQALPVLLPSVGYQEHQAAWDKTGSLKVFYNALCIDRAIEEIELSLHRDPKQHLVIINPNNPSGLSFSVEQLKRFNNLQDSSAMLIVDEAFVDLHPENSLLTEELSPNSIVLRSFGKFFGLAGIRVGCVVGNTQLVQSLATLQGPWAVSGASLFIASEAWQTSASSESATNQQWLKAQRKRIKEAHLTTSELLNPLFLSEKSERLTQETSLFISYLCPEDKAHDIYNFFAAKGILLRYVPVNNEQAIIRSSVINHNDTKAVERLKQTINAFLSNSLSGSIKHTSF